MHKGYGTITVMITQLPENLEKLDADVLRKLLRQSHQMNIKQAEIIKNKDCVLQNKDLHISKLAHEIAVLKRLSFGKKSEQLQGEQYSLWQEAIDGDIAAIEVELKDLAPKPVLEPKQHPKRTPLPASLQRVEIRHEPHDTTCNCGCQLERIGEDVSEKLDYIPGVARVERHIRGKWVCRKCEVLIQEPVPAQVIDKGIATSGLLAHVLVAKYADHLPLYRQEKMFERSGIRIPDSTLAAWVGVCGVRLQPLVDELRKHVLGHKVLHADETPVTMLRPDTGKTAHKAYLWAYASTDYEEKPVVLYEFKPNRSGKNARDFLQDWHGKLVVDDYVGYKKGFEEQNIT